MKKLAISAMALLAVCAAPQARAAVYGTTPTAVGYAYSGTSVNDAIFRCSAMVTHGGHQYMAYYDPEGYLTIGKRRAGGAWETKRSQYKANVADAHNVASIGVDGDGYLHVSFDHHGHPLKYCRTTEPGGLELTPLMPMVGHTEEDVTYPQFLQRPDGSLLFAYRSGQSGNGNLVLNSYDPATGKWTRVHDALIDGEGKRNAYWQIATGADGTLHLSWVWRETWLVETNHDMCYAKSTDGGKTWRRSDGRKQPLPITAANAEYALRIPQNSDLMNQTSMAVDDAGRPYIASYWRAEGDSVPQYRLIWKDGKQWQTSQISRRSTPFTLAGGGTKMVPMSRPLVVVSPQGTVHCIYRDAERGDRVSMATGHPLTGGADTRWSVADLTDYSVGAWEPTHDPTRWWQDGTLSLFVHDCRQGDGERVVAGAPTMVRSLDCKPEVLEVLGIINEVNDHWQQSHPQHGRAFWDNAAYHTGNMEAYRLTGRQDYLDYSKAWAEHNEWRGAKGDDRSRWKYDYGEDNDHALFGDWQICFQTYADIYNIELDPRMIARACEVMEYEMSTPQNDYWWWADGLYMVMPVMTKLYRITGNERYLDKLHEYWHFADDLMYDTDSHLYYRDGKYLYPKHSTASGKKDFWARGDGWVCAALAKVIADMPDSRAEKQEYVQRYLEMMDAVADCQQPGGYWTRSMLDPEQAPGPETSGTAFFTYALLWGINRGMLTDQKYYDAALKAWNYLVNTALQPDGSVGYVQPIGEKAIPGQVVDASSTSNFGTGAFLLAACEMARAVNAGKVSTKAGVRPAPKK